MSRRSCALLVLLGACAHANPRPEQSAAPAEHEVHPSELRALAPSDEPSKLLFNFESDAELTNAHALHTTLALGPLGATRGKQALRITTMDRPAAATTTGVRFDLAPGIFSGFNEVAVDVTNPSSEKIPFRVAIGDRLAPDEGRRHGNISLQPDQTATIRFALQGDGKADNADAVGRWTRVKSGPQEAPLDQDQFLWLLLPESRTAGVQIAVDAVRLVKRNAAGAVISPVKKQKLAVMDVTPLSPELAARAKVLTGVIFDEAAGEKVADVIGADEVRQLLSNERQKELLGCTESSCMSQIAGALGSDYVLAGQIGKLGERLRLDVRLLDAVHARVIASDGAFVPAEHEEQLGDAATQLVKKLLAQSPLKPAS